jgi:hypothetical protein
LRFVTDIKFEPGLKDHGFPRPLFLILSQAVDRPVCVGITSAENRGMGVLQVGFEMIHIPSSAELMGELCSGPRPALEPEAWGKSSISKCESAGGRWMRGAALSLHSI